MLSKSFNKLLLLLFAEFLLLSTISAYSQHLSATELAEEINSKVIYYGSTIRIRHEPSKYHIHSHDLKYGSGSGQQSVTAFKGENDYNSLWTLKNAEGEPLKLYNEPIKCGDKVRVEHALTKKNLHSHDYQSPVSRKFEVSGFGDNGNGDGGDNWQIICSNEQPGTVLTGKSVFDLKHVDTKRFLSTESRYVFDNRNCGHNCPILGQYEVACDRSASHVTKWRVSSGIFYMIKKAEEEHCYGVDCPIADDEFDEDELNTHKDEDEEL